MIETVGTPWLWGAFVGLVLALLALDLGVFHKKDRAISTREALSWTVVWIGVSLLFNGFIWARFGSGPALDFLTGYLIEKSLSVDNLFVFVIVFATFGIPPIYQHRVLFWGILTAIVLRAAMIVGGAALLQRFDWLIYVFGAFLVFTGIKLFVQKPGEHHPEKSWGFRMLRRVIPSTARIEGHSFFVKEGGKWLATPLFLALTVIELSDVIFAVDSIPAIFGVTLDPFIVFTSNIFAILGLRSLYFAMASLLGRFQYLHVGLAAVLLFIGVKMTVSGLFHVNSLVSLAVVVGLLGGSMAYSIVRTRKEADAVKAPGPPARRASSET